MLRKQMKQHPKKNGYSFVELTFTLAIIGIISVITIPSLIYKAESSNALLQTKLIASEIQSAGQKYKQANPDALPSKGEEIADFMKYVGKTTTGTLISSEESCTAVYPCYRFPDGGIIRPTGEILADQVYDFHYDPDGKSNGSAEDLGGVILRLYYETNRITSYGAVSGNYQDDPSYVRSWTKLNP